MIRQIKYFQAVVRNNSFSEAAEECHISQSAISLGILFLWSSETAGIKKSSFLVRTVVSGFLSERRCLFSGNAYFRLLSI